MGTHLADLQSVFYWTRDVQKKLLFLILQTQRSFEHGIQRIQMQLHKVLWVYCILSLHNNNNHNITSFDNIWAQPSSNINSLSMTQSPFKISNYSNIFGRMFNLPEYNWNFNIRVTAKPNTNVQPIHSLPAQRLQNQTNFSGSFELNQYNSKQQPRSFVIWRFLTRRGGCCCSELHWYLIIVNLTLQNWISALFRISGNNLYKHPLTSSK